MTTAIATNTNPMDEFYKKLSDRLREDVAALLPEEALQQMVSKTVQDEFFKSRRIPKPDRSYSSDETIDIPSVFCQMVIDAAKPMIKKCVDKAVVEHTAMIENTVREHLAANMLTVYSAAAITKAIGNSYGNQINSLTEVVRKLCEKLGVY